MPAPTTGSDRARIPHGFGEYVDAIDSAASAVPQFVQARVDKLSIIVEIAAPSSSSAHTIARPLIALVPADVPVQVQAVRYTASQVQGAQDRLDKLPFDEWNRLHIITSGQSTDKQTIEIGIAKDAPTDTETQIRALFPEPFVKIERTDPVIFQ